MDIFFFFKARILKKAKPRFVFDKYTYLCLLRHVTDNRSKYTVCFNGSVNRFPFLCFIFTSHTKRIYLDVKLFDLGHISPADLFYKGACVSSAGQRYKNIMS